MAAASLVRCGALSMVWLAAVAHSDSFRAAAPVEAAAALAPAPRSGIWGYFCFSDTASIIGASPPDYYPSRCWEEQSVKAAPAMQGTLMMVKWRHVEPSPGVYDWSMLDANITKAAALNLQLVLAVEVCKADPADEAAPGWLYDSVPSVNFTHTPKGTVVPANTTNPHRCPYYLDANFQIVFGKLISALATHVASLPEKDMIVGVQDMEGITGDDRPWNGNPIEPQYWITDAEWRVYTRKMAAVYCAAFASINVRVLFNLENPGVNATEDPWIISQCPGAMIKQGIVSHGYQLNGEIDLWQDWKARGLDKAFSRGELAVEPNPRNGTYGNWAYAPAWSLQANAEWALTWGLGMWNLYAGFLSDETFAPTLKFFNTHAASVNVATATAAFIGFRDSLDTADTERFPVDEFGPVHLQFGHTDQLNGTRLHNIAKAMAKYGARQDGDEARSQHSVVQKKGMHLNDVCWRCWPGNYGRYITQLDPLGTSVGRWRLGPKDHPHGRFARALEHESGKDSINLQLDAAFGLSHRDVATQALAVTISVCFFDDGLGSWALRIGGAVTTPVLQVKKTNTKTWLTAVANASLPAIAGDGKGNNISLRSVCYAPDCDNDVFSLLEVLIR